MPLHSARVFLFPRFSISWTSEAQPNQQCSTLTSLRRRIALVSCTGPIPAEPAGKRVCAITKCLPCHNRPVLDSFPDLGRALTNTVRTGVELLRDITRVRVFRRRLRKCRSHQGQARNCRDKECTYRAPHNQFISIFLLDHQRAARTVCSARRPFTVPFTKPPATSRQRQMPDRTANGRLFAT